MTWKRNIVGKGKISAEHSTTTSRDASSFSKKRNKNFLSSKVLDVARAAFVHRFCRSTHKCCGADLPEGLYIFSAFNFNKHTE